MNQTRNLPAECQQLSTVRVTSNSVIPAIEIDYSPLVTGSWMLLSQDHWTHFGGRPGHLSHNVMYRTQCTIFLISSILKPPKLACREMNARSASLTCLFSQRDGRNQFLIMFLEGVSGNQDSGMIGLQNLNFLGC